ncbi:MAG: hypothetical protein SWY16_04535 [Cyanobacteriota bacterium]|nr:hypothetical protein [Cyanobacteriota bacterium]
MIIQTRYTPAPWQLFDGRSSSRKGGQLISASDGKYRDTWDSTPLAWVIETTPTFNQFTPDARLMASAPELLVAVRAARQNLCRLYPEHEYLGRFIDYLDGVIAKATGDPPVP